MKKETRTEAREKREKYLAEAQAIAKSGKCPKCGLPLHYNSAISGWWQCAAYPNAEYRKAEFKDKPSCLFQCFTA